MNYWLWIPPIAFLLFLLVALVQYWSLAALSSGEKWPDAPGKLKSYGCGEDVPQARVQPNYRQFFPFAFFFTIMHVAALMASTAPRGEPMVTVLAVFYLLSVVIGVFILFRR